VTTVIERYEGDPKLVLDENGADLVYRGGQPVMDRGLENAALISLHTREWCGNVLMREPAQRLGSSYEQENEQPLTVSALARIGAAARQAVQWMLDRGVAKDIQAVSSNPTGRRTQTAVKILPPSNDPVVLLTGKYGANWIAQAYDPASERVA
jgi:phage gp46-like protein